MIVTVRPACDSDVRAIGRIHAASWRAAYGGLMPPDYLRSLDPDTLARSWLQTVQRRREQVRVIEMARSVAGYLSWGEPRDRALRGFAAEIHTLYIDPRRWGQGFGRTLLGASLAEMETTDRRWCVLWVLERNTRARRFYEQMGLGADGARRGDVVGGVHLAAVRHAGPLNDVLGKTPPWRHA